MDLHNTSIQTLTSQPHGGTVSIHPGIEMEPPKGTYVRIVSHRRLSFKDNIHVIIGVIDPDYRANVKVAFINQGNQSYTINQGDRITQFILEKVHTPSINIVDNLSKTQRATQYRKAN